MHSQYATITCRPKAPALAPFAGAIAVHDNLGRFLFSLTPSRLHTVIQIATVLRAGRFYPLAPRIAQHMGHASACVPPCNRGGNVTRPANNLCPRVRLGVVSRKAVARIVQSRYSLTDRVKTSLAASRVRCEKRCGQFIISGACVSHDATAPGRGPVGVAAFQLSAGNAPSSAGVGVGQLSAPTVRLRDRREDGRSRLCVARNVREIPVHFPCGPRRRCTPSASYVRGPRGC